VGGPGLIPPKCGLHKSEKKGRAHVKGGEGGRIARKKTTRGIIPLSRWGSELEVWVPSLLLQSKGSTWTEKKGERGGKKAVGLEGEDRNVGTIPTPLFGKGKGSEALRFIRKDIGGKDQGYWAGRSSGARTIPLKEGGRDF